MKRIICWFLNEHVWPTEGEVLSSKCLRCGVEYMMVFGR